MYEHRCFEKLKGFSGKYDDQNQYKAIIEATMVSITEGFTDNSPISYGPYVPVKQHNARKSLGQFSEALDVKPKLLSTGYTLLHKSASQSEQSV